MKIPYDSVKDRCMAVEVGSPKAGLQNNRLGEVQRCNDIDNFIDYFWSSFLIINLELLKLYYNATMVKGEILWSVAYKSD